MNEESEKTAAQFATTHWSVVLVAGQVMSPARTAALEKLCRAYWLPICVFARRKGWNEEDAKDLTQQFFARLLARNDFGGLDPKRGKFRTFLLAAFTHFLANEYDRATALKRGGGFAIVSLDQLPPDQISSLASTAGDLPGDQYDRGWAQAILQAALRELKAEMTTAGKGPQFEALKQFLTLNGTATDYAAAAQKLGAEAAAVPVTVHRLRQRYRALVRAEVAQTVSSPVELEEEMRHLFAVLNQ